MRQMTAPKFTARHALIGKSRGFVIFDPMFIG